jgi:hypothetical protein
MVEKRLEQRARSSAAATAIPNDGVWGGWPDEHQFVHSRSGLALCSRMRARTADGDRQMLKVLAAVLDDGMPAGLAASATSEQKKRRATNACAAFLEALGTCQNATLTVPTAVNGAPG